MADESTTVHPWLAQLPESSRGLVTAWFRHALAHQPASAEALLQRVERLIGGRGDWVATWNARETCALTLLALKLKRSEALSFAQTLLEARQA